MGVVEAGRGLEAYVDRLFGGESMSGVEDLAETAASEVLEDEIGRAALLAPVEDLEDVGVVERGDRSRLGPEPAEKGLVAGERGMENLDRDTAMERDVVGQVDMCGRAGTHAVTSR